MDNITLIEYLRDYASKANEGSAEGMTSLMEGLLLATDELVKPTPSGGTLNSYTDMFGEDFVFKSSFIHRYGSGSVEYPIVSQINIALEDLQVIQTFVNAVMSGDETALDIMNVLADYMDVGYGFMFNIQDNETYDGAMFGIDGDTCQITIGNYDLIATSPLADISDFRCTITPIENGCNIDISATSSNWTIQDYSDNQEYGGNAQGVARTFNLVSNNENSNLSYMIFSKSNEGGVINFTGDDGGGGNVVH